MSLFFLLPTRTPKVTLSGETETGLETDPDDSTVRLRINQDGTIDKSSDTGVASWSQIDTETDWIRPVGVAPGAYEVRYTNLVGDAMTSQSAAEDTWFALSGGDFILTLTRTTVGTDSSTFDIEIRSGSSGSAVASGAYSFSAQVQSGG